MVIHPAVPAKNLQELLAKANKEPGKYVFGSDGTGTGSHLTMELLNHRAGIKLQHAPYQGAGLCHFSNGARYQVHIGN